MDVMTLRRGLMAQMAGSSKLKKLMTLTFNGEVQERKTINPEPSWSEFDFLLIVPNFVISSEGNWIYYAIKEMAGSASWSYDGAMMSGIIDNYKTVVVSKGNSRWGINCWFGGRMAYIPASDGKTIADLTIVYGLYYGNNYGTATGTAEVYGGKY